NSKLGNSIEAFSSVVKSGYCLLPTNDGFLITACLNEIKTRIFNLNGQQIYEFPVNSLPTNQYLTCTFLDNGNLLFATNSMASKIIFRLFDTNYNNIGSEQIININYSLRNINVLG